MTWFSRSIGLILAAVVLAGGYAAAQSWVGVVVMLVLAASWVIGRRTRVAWLNSALLVGYVSASAGGIFFGVSAHWMIAGCAFALAGWELAGVETVAAGESNQILNDLLRRKTVQLLTLSFGMGLLAAELLLYVRVSLPFGVVLLGGVLAFTSLYLLFRTQKSRLD